MLYEVGNELCDTRERANGWPETVLSDRTLCEVVFFGERDAREEGEEMGGCFLFDLIKKESDHMAGWARRTYLSP